MAPNQREEISAIVKIAGPLVIAYLAELAMFVTTKIAVGQLGYVELAGVGIAGHFVFEFLVISMGLLSVIGVLVANAHGSDDKHAAGHATRQGLVIATLIGIPLTLLIWHFDTVLALLGQKPEVLPFAKEYLRPASTLILPTLWFACFRNFVTAISKTGVIMVLTIGAVGINAFFTFGLVFGDFGLPKLGVAGAGWATSIASWFMFTALVVYIYFTKSLRGYGLFKDRIKLDWAVCADLLKLGIPVAGVVSMEAGLFIMVSLMSGILGADVLAAGEILMAWVGVPFVIALAIAEATMVRVAFGAGRGNMLAARQAGLIGVSIGVGLLLCLVVVPLAYPEVIINLFLEKTDPGFEKVSNLVASLFFILAIFQVFDGLQAIASRALRGIRDTVVPLYLAGFGYWVLGIGSAYIMTFVLEMGAAGIWWGLAIGLIITGIFMLLRFLKLTAK